MKRSADGAIRFPRAAPRRQDGRRPQPRRRAALLALASVLAAPRPGRAESESAPRSFAYLLQADAFAATKAAAVRRLAACGRDWIVLDAVYDGGTPWERADLDAIRGGLAGRKALAYLSIGEAEDYRPYWRAEWREQGRLTPAAPAWLGAENPDWKGNFRVQYWRAEWQHLILAAVDDALRRGFDGVYLDIVDGFEAFEQDGRDFIDDPANPETGQSYRRDMVDWVKAIAGRARAQRPDAAIIPQNGSQLLQHPDFLAAISGIGIEDLFTNGNRRQPEAHVRTVLAHVQRMIAARKPVLLIEYPRNAEAQALVKRRAAEHGMTWLITDRPLKTLGESGR